jgi:hypothetical protein
MRKRALQQPDNREVEDDNGPVSWWRSEPRSISFSRRRSCAPDLGRVRLACCKVGLAPPERSSRFRCAVFPPLRRGGQGGGPGRISHKVFPLSVSHSRQRTRSWPLTLVLLHPSREAGGVVFDFQRSRPTPPGPPFARGGKDRSLTPSFDRAQQKHASRNRPSSTVNSNFHRPSSETPARREPATEANPGGSRFATLVERLNGGVTLITAPVQWVHDEGAAATGRGFRRRI